MDPRLDEYIRSHSGPEPPQLAKLTRDINIKLLYPRMSSGHLQGRVLSMLTAMIAPHRALELGTYAAYSTLCIAESLPEGGRLDTVEIDEEMEAFIRARLEESPFGRRVTLHIGDAAEVVPALGGEPFDMAYIDSNKRTYVETYEMLLPLMRPGGFILADNTLWDSKVLEPAANSDPQTAGICAFNDHIAADTRVEQVILPLRDGLTLIRVKP